MKAVIMAGGKGTRLRPLTSHLPKPMVPLLDRPCMEYIIDLLKRHGITEIAVTVQYLPQVIRSHFGDGSEYGVSLHYFEEIMPLGTAGSVKNAEAFLDETFLVISGDALTDFDLSQAIAYHREKQALGTLVLTRVEVPLEYGVVMTQEDGRIIRFLEKPSWSEVFSDTVNTGIYVLEPEMLSFFEPEQTFDFSKDLFPLVMKRDLPLYGYVADGYWSDIGNLTQYRETQFDMLNGLVEVDIKGTELLPQVWAGENVVLEEEVRIEGPAFIGEGTLLQAGAKLGPNAILGRYNRVEAGAEVVRTVVWNRNCIGQSAVLSGATLCHGVIVHAGAQVLADAVIGEKSVIGELAVIKPGVKVWSDKTVGANTIQGESLIWGKSVSQSLFGDEGISGIPNLELTPEQAGKIAAAYVSCLPHGATVSVSCDEDAYSGILKYAVISGLPGGGMTVRDIGITVAPIARYECRRSNSAGGMHIRKQANGEQCQVVLQFFDRDGLPIDKAFERKVENAFLQEDFARPGTHALGLLEQTNHVFDSYAAVLCAELDVNAVRARRFKVVLHGVSSEVLTLMYRMLNQLGCTVMTLFNGEDDLSQFVQRNGADLGIEVDGSGQQFRLYTEAGHAVSEAQAIVLKAWIAAQAGAAVAVPVTAPTVVEEMSEGAGVHSVRTKALTRSLLEVGREHPLQMHGDAFYSLAMILQHLAHHQDSLGTALERLPEAHMSTDRVSCPIESKGRVMRRLMEEMQGQPLELIDGIKVLREDGWALILPDSEKALFKIVAQGGTPQSASQLTQIYKRKIASYQQG